MRKKALLFIILFISCFCIGCESTVRMSDYNEMKMETYTKAYESGYHAGSEDSYSEGYHEGYQEGYEDAERQTWNDMMDTIIDWLPYEDDFYDLLDEFVARGHIKSYRK